MDQQVGERRGSCFIRFVLRFSVEIRSDRPSTAEPSSKTGLTSQERLQRNRASLRARPPAVEFDQTVDTGDRSTRTLIVSSRGQRPLMDLLS